MQRRPPLLRTRLQLAGKIAAGIAFYIGSAQTCFIHNGGNMSAQTITTDKTVSPVKLLTSGALAGLAGGLVFGMMMALMGMLPMVAMLIGSENPAVGFAVHMLISGFIGAVYGVVAGSFPLSTPAVVLGGIINGVVWWLLGALIIMPLALGMNDMVLAIGQTQWLSLMGHIIYGLVTALAFVRLVRRG